ncbi:hypothetical protein GBA52_014694 [Prunus armeniaca]|nr:hypothetical protein GBA52_014694 [Prunus armeniaca]
MSFNCCCQKWTAKPQRHITYFSMCIIFFPVQTALAIKRATENETLFGNSSSHSPQLSA